MTVTYRNQKFFLQIEGESVEISNFQLIKRSLYESDQRITGPCNEVFWLESIVLDGDSFPLPSGIGYRIDEAEHFCNCSQIGLCRKDPCEKYQVATLYVIEEEKDPEIELPSFLYKDDGEIKVGVHGDTTVTDEWMKFLNKLKK